MMDMKIDDGTFRITDDNRILVSKNVADEIYNKYIKPDSNDLNDTTISSYGDSHDHFYRPRIDNIID